MPEFMIGLENNIYDLLPLSELFSPEGDVFDPDWSFQDFAESQELNDGTVKGQGFPVAKWRFNHISNENREILRAFCPGLSAVVYIQTKTNETASGVETWGIFRAVMRWMDTDEDKAASETLGVLLTFTHLELEP
jgi:hypothetical protein